MTHYSSQMLRFALFVSLLFSGEILQAQELLRPIRFNPSYQIVSPTENPSFKRSGTLELPFFDDFSTTAIYPDRSRWTDRSVYINNDFAINPPSIGVASFDGLDKSGYPYNDLGRNANTWRDTLTSNTIDLSGLTPSDSVYMSFEVQKKGNGDMPEAGDSLVLECRVDSSMEWVSIWQLDGGTPDSLNPVFRSYIFTLPEQARFYHDSFQFRFRSFGNPTGILDHYHVDYVYLNKDRTHNDTVYQDLTFTKPALGLTQIYRSMPWSQFEPAFSTYLSRNIDFNYRNLADIQDDPESKYEIYDINRAELIYASDGSIPSIPANESLRHLKTNEMPINVFRGRDNSHLILELRLFGETDNEDDTVSSNHRLVQRQHFHNYLAYDDGSAERGYSISIEQEGSVALRFELSKPDTLRYIAFAFTGGKSQLPVGQKV